ncbi:MAG TPA: DUF5996 family protein [Patescibacteria group bacterium]|nr:DUF5996 family protein [Patescibacteria group bacterium]
MKYTQKELWPPLPYLEWKNTLDTLHMWTQIVGKVKLKLAPFINQWWEVAFYVTATGLTTGRIPYNREAFIINFDFLNHNLTIQTSNNKSRTFPLVPQSVASFYKQFMHELASVEIHVAIKPVPTEVPDPIPFLKDTRHKSYDKAYVTRWWRIVLQTALVFDRFRSPFRGKSSPIQFFWGSFDLSGTRFSGRKATPPKLKGEMGRIMRYAENEENFAFGFWPGDTRFPEPAYYVYLYPKPNGFESVHFGSQASFNEKLAECVFPYEMLRKTRFPEKTLMNFLMNSYLQSASLAGWDIKSLEEAIP